MSELQKLKVLADPLHKGKHPYHDNRFIVTADTEWESEENDPLGGRVSGDGSVIAKMTDCVQQKEYAGKLVMAFNYHDELVNVVRDALESSRCDGDLCAYDWHEAARQVLAKIGGAK